MSHHDPDEVIPRVCDESRLPRSFGSAEPSLLRGLSEYPAMVEERRNAEDPHLLALSDAAHLKALNNVLTTFGLTKAGMTIAVEPAPSPEPTPRSGAIVFSGSLLAPFRWLMRRLFRRGA